MYDLTKAIRLAKNFPRKISSSQMEKLGKLKINNYAKGVKTNVRIACLPIIYFVY